MKASDALLVVPFALLCVGTAWAQDPVKVDPTHYKVVLENSSVRVLKIDYAPGSTRTKWARGDVQFIGRGVPHESKNMSGKPIEYAIVSIK